MPKYKDYVNKMIDENKELFGNFKKLHNLYSEDYVKWQDKFNKEGSVVLELVREYENKLCKNTERGMYNRFSTQLSEKFHNELKNLFPMIDRIGIIVEEQPDQNEFFIKKITL